MKGSTAPRLGAIGIDWRTEVLILALVLAETAAAWLLIRLVLGSASDPGDDMPGVAVFVLLYGAAVTPRLLDALGVWERGYAVGSILAMVATTLVALKLASFPGAAWFNTGWARQAVDALIFRPSDARLPVWGVVLVSSYAWGRGQRRAEPSLDAAHRTLRVGTVVTLLAVLAGAFGVSAAGDRAASGGVLAFFAAALAAVVVARVRATHERDPGAGFGARRWVGPALLPVAAVAAVAVVAAGLFSRDLFDTLVLALSPLLWVLGLLVRILVLVMAVVAFIVLAPLFWLLDRGERRPMENLAQPSGREPAEGLPAPLERVAETPDPIRYLIAAAVLSLLFGAATRFVLRRRRTRTGTTGEDRESVLDLDDLLAGWGRRLRRLARPGATGDAGLDALRGDPRWAHTVAIRETYRAMLAWARGRGIDRPPGATPREHEARLRTALLPADRDRTRREAAAVVTRGYEAARYGGEPATAADAAAVRDAWQRVRRASDN